jgi:putative ABC transport system ATP-binding protein
MKPVLEIKIQRLFYEDRVLCRDIELSVHKGERILIVGATGTGKSSLLSALNLMNPSYEGSIHFEGKDICSFRPEELRSRICMVMQEPWLEEGTIQANLDYPLGFAAFKHQDKTGREQRINALMEAFRFPPRYLEQDTSQLSGGEKQRVALIRALQLAPELLLLDEISSALDQETSGIISDCIFQSFPGTVIAISHDPLWQSRWQRIWELKDGQIVDRQREVN